jgi:hypothetical protein
MGESLHGQERRAELDRLTDEMMLHIARIMPPERRGPYASAVPDPQ